MSDSHALAFFEASASQIFYVSRPRVFTHVVLAFALALAGALDYALALASAQ